MSPRRPVPFPFAESWGSQSCARAAAPAQEHFPQGWGGNLESILLWDRPRGRMNSQEQMPSLTAPFQE